MNAECYKFHEGAWHCHKQDLLIAWSPDHSQILSCSYGEKSGEGLGSLLCHELEMVGMVSV